jgi:5-epi-alpha-selinene synthase
MKNGVVMIPAIYCPFPSEVNRHAEAAESHTFAWVRKHALVKDEAACDRLRASRFSYLAARTFPHASLTMLSIVSDWYTWLFFLDDECDEAGIGKRPERLAALHAQCLDVLSGQVPERLAVALRPRPGRPDVPLIRALDDLRGRMEGMISREWTCRFVMSVSEYFESLVWEARNREQGTWPDPSTYIRIRPYTGAMYTAFDLIDLTEGEALPLNVRKNPCYQRLLLIAGNVTCWCNDLVSLPKERAHHDMHNLALILQHQEGIGPQEAVDRVARLVEREVKRFIALQGRLPSFGPALDPMIGRFVAGMRALMRGNLDWSLESGRYQMAEEEEIAEPTV